MIDYFRKARSAARFWPAHGAPSWFPACAGASLVVGIMIARKTNAVNLVTDTTRIKARAGQR